MDVVFIVVVVVVVVVFMGAAINEKLNVALVADTLIVNGP